MKPQDQIYTCSQQRDFTITTTANFNYQHQIKFYLPKQINTILLNQLKQKETFKSMVIANKVKFKGNLKYCKKIVHFKIIDL